MEYTILIDPNYVVPDGPLNNEQYVDFVMNMAAKSYQAQYGAATPDEGITAARAAFNASLPATE